MTNYRRKSKNNGRVPAVQYVINQAILHPELRVLDEDGEFIGILRFKDALDLAFSKDMDLIEVNAKASPPLCRIMELSKYKYQLSKVAAAKPTNNADKVKTIRLSVRIAPHDMEVNARKIDEFLSKKQKVKIQVRMRGREKSHPELATETMLLFITKITEPYEFEAEPKLVGDSNFCALKPGKKINGPSAADTEVEDTPTSEV